MSDLDKAIKAIEDMEPIGAKAGGSIESQLVAGRPRQLRDDTQIGIMNILAVRKLLQQLGFFAGETCCMEDVDGVIETEQSEKTKNPKAGRVTDKQAMNVLAAVCRVVAERFKRTKDAMTQAENDPAGFIGAHVKLAEKKAFLECAAAKTGAQMARLEARNVQLTDEAANLRTQNAVLSNQATAAEQEASRLAETNDHLQTTIGKQRLLIGILLGALGVGTLGVGAGAAACYKAGLFDGPSTEETTE